MASVSPNSTIKFYKNVPLNNRYEDVIYFASESAKTTYFHSTLSATATLSSQSYARHTANSVKVATSMATLINCNYMAFQNSSFEDKWFYAFITDVEYVNNNCTLVTFEIDVFSTYFTDCTLKQCYVEREHSSSNYARTNLIPEDFKIDSYVTNSAKFVDYNGDGETACTIYYSDDNTATSLSKNVVSGFSIHTYGANSSGVSALSALIQSIGKSGYLEQIAGIIQHPNICSAASGYDYIDTDIDIPSSLDGYTPKNKKLLTYPFCYMVADDGLGGTCDYYFEYSDNDDYSITMECQGSLASKPTVFIAPLNYNGRSKDYQSGITVTSFPVCSYSGDGFQNYLANNRNSLSMTGAIATTEILSGLAMMSNPATASAGFVSAGAGISSIMSSATSLLDKATASKESKGNAFSEGYLYSANHMGVTYYVKCVNYQTAQVIDDFFNMFGYATKRVKTPNISSRPYWNYTKTIGCVITGACPSTAISKMCSCFDNGIRFWKSGSYIGNYSYDNSP